MQYRVRTSTLQGELHVPPSKSHTLRAILFASLAHGKSHIRHPLASPDQHAMVRACQQLGAVITQTDLGLTIKGVAGRPQTPNQVIDAGNSGQVLRFVGAVAALAPGYTVLTGDASIRSLRPVEPLLAGIRGLGGIAISTRENGYAPMIIKGPLRPGSISIHGQDSQPISGLLIATAFLPGESLIHVQEPGEQPWVDLTLDWLRRLGIQVIQTADHTYRVSGGASYDGFDYTVPGDFSSAAFPLVAGCITRSSLTIHGLDMQDVQGDRKIVEVLRAAGVILDSTGNRLHLTPAAALQAQSIPINDFIDALPILAVMACFCEGETLITGAEIARHKESDRIAAICTELKKMGAMIWPLPDGLRVRGTSSLKGAVVKSYHDHRIALALAIAGCAATGETIIEDTDCVAKSYPDFVSSMRSLGANMVLET